jgi:hypothetical protein
MVPLVNEASCNRFQIAYFEYRMDSVKEMTILKYKYLTWKITKLLFASILNIEFEELFDNAEHTWVISKVLHTVCFLFKNKFILQNTFTGLQCHLYCALLQRSNVWASLVFLSGRLRC